MSVAVEELHHLLEKVSVLDDASLLRLAQAGDRSPAPAFRGRCLEPAYLEAVASGAWTPDDERLLEVAVERAAASTRRRLPRRHRRGLRQALQAIALSTLTAELPSRSWQRRRADLVQTWASVLQPIPAQRSDAD